MAKYLDLEGLKKLYKKILSSITTVLDYSDTSGKNKIKLGFVGESIKKVSPGGGIGAANSRYLISCYQDSATQTTMYKDVESGNVTVGYANDSDKLDGIHASEFVKTTGDQTISGKKTFSKILVGDSTNGFFLFEINTGKPRMSELKKDGSSVGALIVCTGASGDAEFNGWAKKSYDSQKWGGYRLRVATSYSSSYSDYIQIITG